jgi:hypothetical protein
MNDTRFEHELRAALRAESDRRVNVDSAWNRFQRRRQATRRRRRLAAAAVAAAAVVALLVPVAVVQLGGTGVQVPVTLRPGRCSPRPQAVWWWRIPVADVISLASYGSDVWALTGTHELARIDAHERCHAAGARSLALPATQRRILETERADQGTVLASPGLERIAHPSADAGGRRAPALRSSLLPASPAKSLRALMTGLLHGAGAPTSAAACPRRPPATSTSAPGTGWSGGSANDTTA